MCDEERTKEKLFMSQLLLTLEGLARQLNTITEKNIEILEQNKALVSKNAEAFKLAGEDFTRRIIEVEVQKHISKNKIDDSGIQQLRDRKNEKKIKFNITNGGQRENSGASFAKG